MRPHFLVALGAVLTCALAPAAPSLKLKRYFALKVKPFNQSMFAAQDRNGNYYLAGTTSATQFDFASKDWLVAKFSASGAKLWHRTFNGKGNGGDIPGGIVVDRLGNVIVCGYTTGVPQEGSSGAVVKWDTNGNRKYVRYSPGTASAGFEYDDYRAIAVDYLNNVYVTGSKTGSPVTGIDLLVEKLSPALTPIWSKTWSQSGSPNLEQGLMIDLHANGTVYVGGDAPIDQKNAGGFWVFTSQGANTKFIRYLGKDGFGRVSRLRCVGDRVYVFGQFKGTGFLANEDSLFSNVHTSSGAVIYNRLTIGNSTISRNTVDGAVGPDGSYLHVANTFVNGANSDTLGQALHFSSGGVFGGLTSVNLPNAVFGEGGQLFETRHGGVLYKSFVGSANRMYYAPIVNGVLQSNKAVALNLASQGFDRPVFSPLGELLVPYTENGAAGVRVFLPGDYAATIQNSEVKRGGKVKIAYGVNPLVGGRMRVRLHVAGQDAPFLERNPSFGIGADGAEEEVLIPATAPVGGYITMTMQALDSTGKPIGEGTVSFIPIVP